MVSSRVIKRLIGVFVVMIGMMIISSCVVLAESGSTELTLGVTNVISMTITGNNDENCSGFDSCSTFGNISPNTTATTSSTISVYTNSTEGYILSVKATNHADLRTESGNSIPAGVLTETNNEINTGLGVWSYKTDSTGVKTNWTAMTATDTPIKGTSIYGATESETVVTYGISMSNNQPSGNYTTELTYTATAPNDTEVVEPNPSAKMQGENVTFSVASVPVTAGGTGTVTITPAEGYYLDSLTCTHGYTTNATTGTSATSAQTVTITNPNVARSAVCTAIAKEVPQITIADASSLQEVNSCPSTLTTGQVYTVEDSRDHQSYNVAKLADDKCWMVENLNIAGGTALSADDTDVTSAYISSFSTSNNLTKTDDTIVLPTSSTSGFDTNNYSYVYNSGNKSTNCSGSGCYSYYSWDAATLGSGRGISTDNIDAEQSICPNGWRLPTSRTTGATNWQITSDFYVLAHQYGLDSTTSTYESDNGFYTQAGPGTTPNFLLAGYYGYSTFTNSDSDGYYWSSTSHGSVYSARGLNLRSGYVGSADYYSRYRGHSVRCVFDGQ